MENFSYHVPVFPVTNGVATAGHSSDLLGGEVGLYDRHNFSVATSSGLANELFLALGNIGGRGWFGEPVEGSHKSPFFLVKDVEDIYKSFPQKIQNEEWIIGYDGSQSSKSLEYVKGETTAIKLYFHGEPTYRMFNGPKEYVISYTPPVDCTDDCATECGGPRQDPKPSAIKHIDLINNHVELKKLGVRATLVESTYVPGAPTMEKYSLSVMDDGTGVALAKVQKKYPGVYRSSRIKRTSRDGIISTYEFFQPTADAAPANFQYDGQFIKLADCGTCPAGWTSIDGYDEYIVRRPLSSNTDLHDTAAQTTFANTIGTAYSATSATYFGQNGAYATVRIRVASGATVTPAVADEIEFSYSAGDTCQSPAGATVAWALVGTGISGSRTLKIKLNRPDCAPSGDRLDDIEAALEGVAGVDIDTLEMIAGQACVDEYTVEQASGDFFEDGCLSSEVSFTYDEPLPSIDGYAWEVQDPEIPEVSDRKVGIRISAGYYDPKFGKCSFDPTDYYENMPLKFELSLLREDASACIYGTLPTSRQTKIAKIARQSGEWLLREVIMKNDAYQKHVNEWDANPRMREAFNIQVQNTVDRNAFYTLWYVRFGASYNATSRKGLKEKFTAVIAFKESDPALATFENLVIGTIASKSGVVPHVNGAPEVE